jgi:hypothetical protein
MKRIIVSVLMIGSIVATPAVARDGWNAASAVLGAAGGFALGSALANPYPRPVYVARPAPIYVESYEEAPVCFVRRQRYINAFGDVTIRRTRVCE